MNADFEESLYRYIEKESAEALVCFNHGIEVNPADRTARFHLERSAQFMGTGGPESWEGVERVDRK